MRSALFSVLAALPALLALPQAHVKHAETGTAPEKRQDGSVIPDSWIVTFNKDSLAVKTVEAVVAAAGIDAKSTYDFPGFKGFAFDGPQTDADKILNLFPNILTVTPNFEMYLDQLYSQGNAPWGLARISHRERGATDYVFEENPGAGTFAYMIDSGINTGHQDFGGRARFAANFINDGKNYDCNGHGTHTAGTVGGNTYGVAKNANLIGIKIFGCDGSSTGQAFLDAMNFAVNDANNNGRADHSVINLSLGSTYNQPTNDAVQAAINNGIFVAVSAGNSNDDTANYSPASVVDACTVGATDKNDVRASFSNFGPTNDNDFDLWAPGVDVVSTWIGSNTATKVLSGTSMAAPHVAGLALYRISKDGPAPPVNLCFFMRVDSTKDHVQDTRGSYNFLAYNNNGF